MQKSGPLIRGFHQTLMRMNKLATQMMSFENFTSLSLSPVSLCTKSCIFHGNKYSHFRKKARVVSFHQPISVIDSNVRLEIHIQRENSRSSQSCGNSTLMQLSHLYLKPDRLHCSHIRTTFRAGEGDVGDGVAL